jgi:hypothetical protein
VSLEAIRPKRKRSGLPSLSRSVALSSASAACALSYGRGESADLNSPRT